MAAIIETRTPRTRPGLRAELLETFPAKTAPAHEAIGMKVLGPFMAIDDSDAFSWRRVFPDARARDALKSALHDEPRWKEDLEKTLFPMLDRCDVVLVEDVGGALARRS